MFEIFFQLFSSFASQIFDCDVIIQTICILLIISITELILHSSTYLVRRW